MIGQISAMIRPLRNRIANMISRAVVTLADDTTGVQEIQADLLTDETRTLERIQNYGFTSVPKPGAEAVVVFVGGGRDHGIAIAADDRRYRIGNLESGEVAVYDDLGSRIVLKRNGDIEITPASGVAKVIGDIEADGVSLKTHTHGPGDYAVGSDAVTGTSGGPS